MKQLHEYMDPAATYFTSSTDKDQILEEMVKISFEAGKVPSFEEFKAAIFERESIMSTGIGLGVAVPHARLPGIDDFFIATGILKKPVEWQAIDDQPVSLVFLIGGPDNRQKDYLRILSKLVLFSKNEKRRKALLAAEKPQDVIDHFTPHE